MHNCRTKDTTLTELAFDETPPNERERLLNDINACPNCHEGYISMKNALRVADDAFRASAPREEFWPGYHSRLQQRLVFNSAMDRSQRLSLHSRLQAALAASFRVPVPVGLALVLISIGAAFLWAEQSQTKVNSIPVQQQTIEVPLIREQVVTRVVYVRKTSRGSSAMTRPTRTNRTSPAWGAVATLNGFQPTHEVNLTVIKGTRNER